MQRDDFIEVEAQVMECLPNQLFCLEMPNGHRVLGHLSKKLQTDGNQILLGMWVRLFLRPFDLSTGWIAGECEVPSRDGLNF